MLFVTRQVDNLPLLLALLAIVLVLWIRSAVRQIEFIRVRMPVRPVPCQIDPTQPETYPGQHADLVKYGHLCRFALANSY
jgi:hypothetical protein